MTKTHAKPVTKTQTKQPMLRRARTLEPVDWDELEAIASRCDGCFNTRGPSLVLP